MYFNVLAIEVKVFVIKLLGIVGNEIYFILNYCEENVIS